MGVDPGDKVNLVSRLTLAKEIEDVEERMMRVVQEC